MSDEMGWQLKLYVGPSGSTASTQVTQASDVDYDMQGQRGSTTVRGSGAYPPVETSNVTTRKPVITWKMIMDPTDSVLATILAASVIGGPIAIKVTTGSGAILFDGDCTVFKKYNAPLTGEGSYDFTAEATKQSGRSPVVV